MFDIVIVDDQATGLRILQRLVKRSCPDSNLHCFSDPTLALSWSKDNTCDLLITDLLMPQLPGNALIRWFRTLPHCADVPVMVVTVADDRQRRHAALRAGATDFLQKPLDAIEFEARCKNLLRYREHHLLLSDRALWLEKRVRQSVAEIERRELDGMLRLARAGELRENFKGRHVKRIGEYAALVARELGQDDDFCRLITYAAPLHDIGKVGIPDAILLKQGRLTDQEKDIMKCHPRFGHDLLVDSPSPAMRLAASIALHHHENFDGTGYPDGLRGHDIPLEARIVAVVDVFDALMSPRPYKTGWPLAKVLDHLKTISGSKLDPDCLDAFLSVLDSALVIHERLRDEMDAAGPVSDGHDKVTMLWS
jgi:response regulator RpfG family c-di-GMP phosphodiesterase